MLIRTAIVLLLLVVQSVSAEESQHCPGFEKGQRQVFWGDMHIHTSFSLDAYAYGLRSDPGDAFAFAKGQELLMADGKTLAKLDRPLDFAAVTDHADFFNVMYVCTDPEYSDHEWCSGFRSVSTTSEERLGFIDYLVPLLTEAKPKEAPFCDDLNLDCKALRKPNWVRAQQFANQADAPCSFTALVANEWTATPNFQHWHRNIIFASDKVTEHPINYTDQQSPEAMWEALERECRAEDGCDAVAIPHNINLAQGGGFDVETASMRSRQLRARYERLAEIHQTKGNSECLAPYGEDGAGDCDYERMLINQEWVKKGGYDKMPEEVWNQFRQSYYRTVLGRGLAAYQETGFNPLQLGAIASTDTHVALAGYVDEANYYGGHSYDIPIETRFRLRPDENPGGLIAVWAEENTRASIFSAIKERRVYGTSGPRITVEFSATFDKGDPCNSEFDGKTAALMGGELKRGRAKAKPKFSVSALQDKIPLARIDIVRGVMENGKVVETVKSFSADSSKGRGGMCVTWSDDDYDAKLPAYWYARVLEVPTKRWSAHDCEREGLCEKYAKYNVEQHERAWASPIWNHP
jgi:hypothetical protein